MKWFFVLLAYLAATTFGFWLAARFSWAPPIAGMQLACLGETEPCWITVGGVGVVTLGFGAGIVAIGVHGVGLLFATGQLAIGLVAIGQLGVGLVFYVGQVGLGLSGLGQGMFGWIVAYQGGQRGDGQRYLRELRDDLDEVLSPFRRPAREP